MRQLRVKGPAVRLASAFAGAALAAGCGGPDAPLEGPRRGYEESPASPRAVTSAPAPMAAVDPPPPVVLVTDPAALAALEASGLDLGTLLDGAPARTNEELARGASYASMARVLEEDFAAAARADPLAGVGVGSKPHRLFDRRWLRAASHRFELVGVADRIDRAPFTPGRCGEARLVYRLAYGEGEAASRLPATVAVTLFGPPREGDGCTGAARRWRIPDGLAGAALAERLAGSEGPLAPGERSGLKAVETNIQSVRFPSTIKPDLGGHAEYLLRAFRPAESGGLEPGPLENTPDVARLTRDRGLRAELLALLSSEAFLDAIEAGSPVLPARFLAKRALSVSPHGLLRRTNRPFSSLFRPADFEGLPLDGREGVASPAALLRRLDGMSCQGCHQARSVAGFHLLGVDPPGRIDALDAPSSPHLALELRRRARIARGLARGGAPSLRIPSPERPEAAPGGQGAPCGLGDPGFSGWTCAEGLVCAPLEAGPPGEVGSCVGSGPPREGDACESGVLVSAADPRKDRIGGVTRRACAAGGVCEASAVGFPSGMCSTSCDALTEDGVCGAIPVLGTFNACLARKEPFSRCIIASVRPAGLRACSSEAPCRDDYVCARLPGGEGACMPPYFLFQLRVDGHP